MILKRQKYTEPTWPRLPSQGIHDIQRIIQNSFVALESEIALEKFLVKEQRKPKWIVFPHLIKGNFGFGKPLRTHFVGLGQLSSKVVGGKDVDL